MRHRSRTMTAASTSSTGIVLCPGWYQVGSIVLAALSPVADDCAFEWHSPPLHNVRATFIAGDDQRSCM